MSKKISKKRLEMGEEAWAEHQRLRNVRKVEAYKLRNVRKVVEWRRRAKLALIEYKGGKCEQCGYNKPCVSCYDFHHIDPSQKDFRLGGCTKNFERLKQEVDKCRLLCKLCHAELHDAEYTKLREANISRLEKLLE